MAEYDVALYLKGKELATPANTKWFQFSGRGFNDGTNYILPCLNGGILFAENGDGASPINITLNNNQDDTWLLDMRNYNFSGMSYEIWLHETATGTWTKIHNAIIDTVLVRQHSVVVKTRDHHQVFDKEINPKTFAGDATTYEGAAELKEVTKPRVLGNATNITPILLNESLLLYGCNWDDSGGRIAVSSFAAVRDRGVAITAGTSHATEAALIAATVTAGQYDYCISKGLFMLGSAPAGLVTCDVTQTGSDDFTDVIDTMVADCYALGVTYINEANIATVTKAHYLTEKTTWLELLRAMIKDTGIVYYFNRAGKLIVHLPRTTDAVRATFSDGSLLAVKSSFSDGSLKDGEIPILTIDIEDGPVPPLEFGIRYDEQFTVQSADDVAGSVSPPDAWAYADKTYSDDNSTNAAAYPLAEREDLDIIVDRRGGAVNLANWIQEFRGKTTDAIVITVPLFHPTDVAGGLTGTPPISTSDLGVGSNVYIKTAKLNISETQKFRVMSYTIDTSKMIVTYHLLGERS